MPGTEPEVKFEQVDHIQVISIVGSLTDRVRVQKVSKRITDHLLSINRPRVVICLDQVKEVSSAILGALVKIDKQVRLKQGKLHVCGMQPRVQEVFQLSRLDAVLAVYETTDAAIRGFE